MSRDIEVQKLKRCEGWDSSEQVGKMRSQAIAGLETESVSHFVRGGEGGKLSSKNFHISRNARSVCSSEKPP